MKGIPGLSRDPGCASASAGGLAESPGPVRTAAALFLMAFGYALLSVCLFRVVSLVFTGTAFFVFYFAVGMPVGGWFARKRRERSGEFLSLTILALVPVSAGLPLLAWLNAQAPDYYEIAYLTGRVPVSRFWALLLYQTAVTFPFFALWGAAEFIGFEAAMRQGRLRRGFYLIFVWALVAAMAFGQWSVPRWGWLTTVAVVPVIGLLARDILAIRAVPAMRRIGGYVVAFAVFAVVGSAEIPFQSAILPKGFNRPSDPIRNGRHPLLGVPLQTAEPAGIEHMEWGKFCHFATLSCAGELYGYYDGVVIWWVAPRLTRTYRISVEAQTFGMLPPGCDICLIGAGGGKQIKMALETNPRRVVAIEVVPEVVEYFRNEGAQFNGGAYLDPRVEVVVGDGRRYLERTSEKFDLIMLPNTESYVAAFRGVFDPGESLHTVESMRLIRERLKSGGVAAVVKGIDVNKRLYDIYARTMRRAGMGVEGWHREKYESEIWRWEAFVLLGWSGEPRFRITDAGARVLSGERFSTHPDVGMGDGPFLADDSPWIMAVFGNIFEKRTLQLSLGILGILGITGCAALAASAARKKSEGAASGERNGTAILLVVAGIAVGANFVCLENAVILWLVRNMYNPLEAFFVGSAIFLLAWGAASLALKWWKIAALAGAAGAFGLAIVAARWNGGTSALCLCALSFAGGIFFPLLAIAFQRRLLDLFVADAFGAVLGGLVAIWLPLIHGADSLFLAVPLVWLLALLMTGLAVSQSGISGKRRQRHAEKVVASGVLDNKDML
ncbi:MAG TPA: hypothetical protein PL033_13240 [Candidatus Brocadiia bacterium]|nr:hypothetical protein [Candidatus Brocadiia bacterium]